MNPKISIVTPSFNQGQFIEETICSVLDQNYSNLEYIIIDGGSTDNTIQIIKKYKKHLKYWVSEPDNGQSDAINKGLKHCSGSIFNWLNSDDLLETGTLAFVADRFSNPEIDIVTGHEVYFGNGIETVKNGSIIYKLIEQNLINGVIYQPSTFWRMEAINPFLPIGEHFHYLMDTHLWVSYIMKNGIKGIDKVDNVLARFRLHDASKTVGLPSEFLKERWALRRGIVKHLYPEFTFVDKILSTTIERAIDIKLPETTVEINQKRLFALLFDELCIRFYTEYEYDSIQSVLKLAWDEKIFSNRLFQYFIRLNLIPRKMLNRLRNG